MTTVWIQEWEESERGWGVRPDGHTIHLRKKDIQTFLQRMRDAEAEQGYSGMNPPECYSRPDGEPYMVDVEDSDIVTMVKVSDCGVWGKENHCPWKKIS